MGKVFAVAYPRNLVAVLEVRATFAPHTAEMYAAGCAISKYATL